MRSLTNDVRARLPREPRRQPPSRRPDVEATAAVDALRRLLRELRILARQTELATGLSPAQLFVLAALVEQPGQSIKGIAEAIMTDRSSVAQVLDRLVGRRFVTRDQSPHDRRQLSLRITALGRRAMARAAPPATAVLLAGIGALAPSQRRALATGLTALTRSMGIDTAPAGVLFDDAPRRRPPHNRDR